MIEPGRVIVVFAGHALHPSHRPGTFGGTVWCWRCGAYAIWTPKNLAYECQPPGKWARFNLARMRRGIAPHHFLREWPLSEEQPFMLLTCDGCGHCGAGVPEAKAASITQQMLDALAGWGIA